jgi:hypothetical protein
MWRVRAPTAGGHMTASRRHLPVVWVEFQVWLIQSANIRLNWCAILVRAALRRGHPRSAPSTFLIRVEIGNMTSEPETGAQDQHGVEIKLCVQGAL